jgi:SnoaL-like polyketide cyclase
MGASADVWGELVALINKQADLGPVFTNDAVYTAPFGRLEGRQAISDFFNGADKGVSDTKLETSVLLEDGDIVMGEWTYTYTVTGRQPFPEGTPQPAFGTKVKLEGATVGRIRGGMFVTFRDYYDRLDMMKQLGL